jgi:parallel beta-helix repeat protein
MRQRLRSRLTYANVAAPLISLPVLATSVVVALVAVSDGQALAANQLSCGDTITTDATLHHNLVNCPNNGIIIGADDVTLDLNYHRIDGDGSPAAGCDPQQEFCDTGIVSNRHDGVTVVHGSVRDFTSGADIERAQHARVLGISATRNSFSGFVFFKFVRSLVRNSSGSHNPAPEGDGMILFDCSHVRILHNSIRDNAEPGLFIADSTHNLIKGNRFSRNEPGILLERSDRNQVRRNRSVRDGEIGIYVAPGNRNVIARNRISHPKGTGIEVDGGQHNVFAHNWVRDTGADGIVVGFDAGVGNVVRRNHIRRAGDDGVHVNRTAEPALLRRNRTRHSKDDGFDVDNRGTKLTRNRAIRNGDLGIEAVRGVIDGGGNKASGNGDLRQCTHIACG